MLPLSSIPERWLLVSGLLSSTNKVRVSQCCCKVVTRVSQGCRKGVIRVLQGSYKGAPRVLQECYKGATRHVWHMLYVHVT
jgi:hypothetical protein